MAFRGFRHMRTRQERSANDLHYQEGLRVRGRRRLLPSDYDDVSHGRRGKGWKDQSRARKSWAARH